MSLEELDDFYRQQRRARFGTLLLTGTALGLTAWGISLLPDGPPPTVESVDVPAKRAQHLRFGEATPAAGPAASADPEDTAPPPPRDEDAAEADVVEAVNTLRREGARCAEGGLSSLSLSPSLADAALLQAEWLAQSGVKAHDTPGSPHGTTPLQRAVNQGFAGAQVGEVLAWNSGEAEDVVAWWEASPTHCAVLTQPGVTEVGAGVSEDVWVVLVGG